MTTDPLLSSVVTVVGPRAGHKCVARPRSVRNSRIVRRRPVRSPAGSDVTLCRDLSVADRRRVPRSRCGSRVSIYFRQDCLPGAIHTRIPRAANHPLRFTKNRMQTSMHVYMSCCVHGRLHPVLGEPERVIRRRGCGYGSRQEGGLVGSRWTRERHSETGGDAATVRHAQVPAERDVWPRGSSNWRAGDPWVTNRAWSLYAPVTSEGLDHCDYRAPQRSLGHRSDRDPKKECPLNPSVGGAWPPLSDRGRVAGEARALSEPWAGAGPRGCALRSFRAKPGATLEEVEEAFQEACLEGRQQLGSRTDDGRGL